MTLTYRYLVLYVSVASVLVNAFDPFTTTVVVGVGATLGRTIYNYFRESCDAKWIAFNATGEGVGLCRDWGDGGGHVVLSVFALVLPFGRRSGVTFVAYAVKTETKGVGLGRNVPSLINNI